MFLVSSVKFIYQVNGSRSRVVLPGRGWRQGHPLSPYLFILLFDIFSRMISRASSMGNIKGVRLAPNTHFLTHLFFADDAILFG